MPSDVYRISPLDGWRQLRLYGKETMPPVHSAVRVIYIIYVVYLLPLESY
jgi:hypothetical protein